LSQFGTAEEAAKLLLPRGSLLLGSSTVTDALPPRETLLGPVEIPPRNYYL
jgi:hypothetical protein